MAAKPKTPTSSKSKHEPEQVEPQAVAMKSAAAQEPPLYKKADLIADVAARAGVKKREAKPIVDAVLQELGAQLAQEITMQVPPLGKLRVTNIKPTGNADVLTLKLRTRREP